jgi:23S rRNA-/tRNA-specific pseudouridylate synthase
VFTLGTDPPRVESGHIVRENDVISRLVHVHESPVLDEAVRIVHEDEEVLVVDKPASWPVHPCGNYRLNSLVYILGRDRGYRNLRPIHRLDKVQGRRG